MSFLHELKRRQVYRVAILYLVVALGVIEGTDLIQGNLDLPVALGRFVTIAALAGFPIAILLAWVYDLTAKGVERTEDPEDGTLPTPLISAILLSLAIVLGGTGMWVTRSNSPAAMPSDLDVGERSKNPSILAKKPSIAVLPFLSLSDDPEQAFFADGITEDLTTDLSKIPELFVISRSSAFTYKGRSVDLKEIGRQLGVRYLLEGSVRKVSERVRITAQLIDATTGYHLWGDRFDRDLSDLFDIQNEINEEILAALRIRIAETELARIRRQPMENLNAYESWHKGRMLILRLTKQDILEGRRLLERAIELQPSYAEAYIGLSNSYLAEFHTWNLDPALLTKAEELAHEGLRLNALNPFAYVNLALLELGRFRPEEAIRLAHRALELAPSDFQGHSVLGGAYLLMQQREEAIESLEKAVRLNPVAPDVTYTWLASALYFSGRREEAVGLWERVRSANPEALLDRLSLTMHYQDVGDADRAEQIVTEILQRHPEFTTEQGVEMFELGSQTLTEAELETIRRNLRDSGLP